MATYKIDLASRIRSTFGFAAERAVIPGFHVPPVIAQEDSNPFRVPADKLLLPDEAVKYTVMGTPLFDFFRFVYNSADGQQIWEPEIPPMVDLQRGKKIKVTEINQGEGLGEVVESWGNDAWDITFRGILVDMQNHRRPDDQLRALQDFFEINEQLICESILFNALKIRSIYFNSKLSIQFTEGFLDTIGYTINARSYVPAELKLAS